MLFFYISIWAFYKMRQKTQLHHQLPNFPQAFLHTVSTFKTYYTFTGKKAGDSSHCSSSCKLERGRDVAACTNAICVSSVSACAKFLPHITQSYCGLLVICLDTICVFRLPLWLKFLPHTWQTNGFSAVWVTEWAFALPRVVNRFPQTSHTYGLSPAQTEQALTSVTKLKYYLLKCTSSISCCVEYNFVYKMILNDCSHIN